MYYGFISRAILTFITVCFSTQLFSAMSFIAGAGQPAVGFPEGSTYQGVINASMGPSGHVAFTGSADSTNAVWSGLPGQLKVIIQENESPVGFPSNVLFESSHVHFNSGSIPIVTKSGSVGFTATLKGAVGRNTVGVFAHVGGSTRGIIKSGDQAPGFPPGSTINIDSSNSILAFTDAGMLISTIVLDSQTGFRPALYFYDFNKFDVISIPSSIAGNCQFGPLVGSEGASINQSGEVIFSSILVELEDDGCPMTSGVFKWANGNTTILQAGNGAGPSSQDVLVPGMNDTHFSLHINQSTSNDQGDVTFSANLASTSERVVNSVWVKSGSSSPKLLALAGESLAKNPNDIISDNGINSIVNTNLSDNGFSLLQVATGSFGAFSSSLLFGKPREQPYTSLDQIGESHLTVVSRLNEQSPGFGSASFFSEFTGMAINRSGQFIFSATVDDAIDGSRSSTVYRGDSSTPSPELVIKSGMQVNLFNTSFLVNNVASIVSLRLDHFEAALSTSGGERTLFSDNGDILISASMTEDNTNNQISGFFLITNGDVSNEINNEARIFSLAEQKLPNLFAPANSPDQTAEGFLFRYYPTTNTYIGIKAGEVFVLGEPFGPDVLKVGTIPSVLGLLENR